MTRGPKRIWTEAEVAKLTELWNAGVSDKALVNTFGRELTAIESKRRDLGLVPRDRRAAMWIQRRNLARGG